MSRFLIALLLFRTILASLPKVTLNHGGSLVGNFTRTINGRQISSFKGIPYAQPPIGDLRFASPQAFSWSGERDASSESAICLQVEASIHGTTPFGQEDCLYLNVYVPTHVSTKKKPLPVMVWFHEGGWSYGSGGEADAGPQYLLDKDVILVAGNYRLNIFGFLSSETLDCPGNFGLKDQVEILKWVNKHISCFGGDPNSVTIFGKISGSISVMYLMHSQKSQHLFHRAIAQSGTHFNPFGRPHIKGTAAQKAKQLARLVNCDNYGENWRDIIVCLRELPGDTLIREFHTFYEWELFPTVPLLAVIEDDHKDAFITEDPRTSAVPQNIPLMIGYNYEEGILFSSILLTNERLLQQMKENFTNLLPFILYYNHLDEPKRNEITDKIVAFYLKNGHDYNVTNFENFTQIITDGMFLAGYDKCIRRRISQSSPLTYAYVFNHQGSKSLTSILSESSDFYGLSHADELQYIFPWSHILNNIEDTFRDQAMRAAIVDFWTNFAIRGNPTRRRHQIWKPVDGFPWNFAVIGSQDPNEYRLIWNDRELAKDRIDFWNSINLN